MSVVLLGVTEAALRAWAPPTWIAFSWELPSTRPAAPLKRGAPLRTLQDGPYAWRHGVDADGLREDTVAPRAEPGVVRLLAVGDSWIYGYSADRGATLPDALEALLPAALGVERVEVLNAGAPGANVGAMTRATLGHLARYPDVSGVLFGQPHNPRTPAPPGKKGARPAAPEPPAYTYAALRRLLAPLAWRSPPRNNAVGLDAEVADLARLVAQLRAGGRSVWLALFPHEQGVAMSGRFGPEREWLSLDVPMAGHALADRACWGWEDPFHPSPAGYRAIAEVLVPVIAEGARRETWATEPACGGVEGWPGP